MHQARVRHRPRYLALGRIRNLSAQLAQIAALANSLKADRDAVEKSAKKIQENINKVCRNIMMNDNIDKKEMDKQYQGLVDQINKELATVKSKIEKQKAAEEQAKLRALQQQMEEQRRQKEAEEAEVRRQEEERRQKQEMEVKRKAEEEKRRKQEEKDGEKLASMQQDLAR